MSVTKDVNRTLTTYLLLAGALFLAVTLLPACSSTEQSSQTSADLDTLRPDSDMLGATIYMYDRSIVTAEINAERVRKYDSIDSTMGYKLHINLFNNQGDVISRVVGDSGLIRESTEDLHIYGDVVVINDNNSRLETDSLYFDPRTDSIYTDEFVRISRPGDTLTGWGLQADRQLRGLRILRQVSGTIGQKKDGENTEQ